MADQLYIGIDSGTQGTKGVVLSGQSGEFVAESYHGYELIENERGGREQHPESWIEACTNVLTDLLSAPSVKTADVKAIGVSGQQHGMVPLDDRGRVIRPAKLWCDTETVRQCEIITARAGGEQAVLEAIGNQVAAGFTASKVLWLKDHEPESYERLATVLLPHEYINFWLTGEMAAEYGDASGTAYFDVVNRRWSETLIQAIDPSGKLRECLPEFVAADEPVGHLRTELCERFNLSPELLVSAGGGDNMMAAIGTGNVSPGVVTASLGTSGTIYAYADRPVVDDRGELASFCSSSGGWLPLVCTMNVTVATELMRSLLGLDLGEMNRLAEAALPGAEGVVLVPYFNGERTPPLPGATAHLGGLTSLNMNRQNFCRAAMEGATFGLRYGLEVIRRTNIEPREIRMTGGGAKSPLWRQLVADNFNCEVVCVQQEEAGAAGAALQALWCAEKATGNRTTIEEITARFVALDEQTRCEPDHDSVAAYVDLYEAYLDYDQVLRPVNSV
jgi:D-xylulose kinase